MNLKPRGLTMDRKEYTLLRRAIRTARREDQREPVLASTKIMRMHQPSREQRLMQLVPERLRSTMHRRGDIHVASSLLRMRLQQYFARRNRAMSLARGIAAYRAAFPIAA